MRRSAIVLSAVLLIQAGVFYAFSRREAVPPFKSFDSFPAEVGNWRLTAKGTLSEEAKSELKADDYISREYVDSNGRKAALFVAFFKTQRYGQEPHSPKNCLPGNGFVPIVSDRRAIDIPGRADPISVNRYIVARGEAQSVVMYWYQSRDRVVASEILGKIYTVLDALRYNRSDAALVRVVVEGAQGEHDKDATRTGEDFIKAFFQTLRAHLPA